MATSAPKINLLSAQKQVFDKRQVLVGKIKFFAGIGLVVYGVLLAIIVIVNLLLSQQITQYTVAADRVRTALTAKTAVIAHYEQIIARVKSIQVLMKSRQEVVTLWQKLQRLLPEGTNLTQFSIEGDTLSIGIETPHVVSTGAILDMIEPALTTLGASKAMTSVSRGEDASYRIDIILAITPEST
jgi:Tfp pilus assembly protein PilN